MYHAVPGTIPHRVIQFLKGQPEGAKFTSVEIADALGIEEGFRNMAAYLSAAIAHDAILRDYVPGTRTIRWWLNPNPPEEKPRKVSKWGPNVEPPDPIDDKFTGFEDLVKGTDIKLPKPTRPKKTKTPPPSHDSDFFAAAYVDGSVEIRLKNVRLVLNAEDANKLARLLAGTR